MKYDLEYTVNFRYRGRPAITHTFKTEVAARADYERMMKSKSALEYCSLAEWYRDEPGTNKINFIQLEKFERTE